jgi:hypothetical protein
MSSQIWERDPQEAFENPYEYEVQEQFAREASALLERLYRALNSDKNRYTIHDRSIEKAVWLLQMDALDSLQDCLQALGRKNHRVAGRLFRDVVESLDLASYFFSQTKGSPQNLQKWYANEIVDHNNFRQFLKKTKGLEASEFRRSFYRTLSKFTHRSYAAILDGYSQGSEDLLVHDATGVLFGSHERAATILVLPATIASYYALLAQLIRFFAEELVQKGRVTEAEVSMAFKESLEPESVPRRFMPRQWFLEHARSQGNHETDEGNS